MVVGSGEEVILILLSVSFYINKVVLKKGVCRRFFLFLYGGVLVLLSYLCTCYRGCPVCWRG